MPEVGLDYMYTHRQSFATNASDPAWDITSDSLALNQVTATADLQWTTRLDRGTWQLTPQLALLTVFICSESVSVSEGIIPKVSH